MKNNNSKKKVMLHIIMPNQISGPNTSSKIIAKSFLKEKYDFVFLTQSFHAGGKINLKLILNLYKQIVKEKPDIIHLNGLQASGFHAAVAAKIYRKSKIIMAIRGFSSDSLSINSKVRVIHQRLIEPLTLKLVNSFYTVCKYAGQNKVVLNNSSKYFGHIHNSAPDVTQTKAMNGIREELEIPNSDIVITAASRIVEDKGYPFLIEPIKRLLKENNNLTFIIVGTGNYLSTFKEELKSEIQNNKLFFLNQRNDVIEILKDSNIFVFPTLHENLSNSLLEAASTNNAIVATNVGGNPEVIIHKHSGLLVNAKDSTELYKNINYLIKNNKKRNELAENAKTLINKNFSQDQNLKKLDKLYESMLKDVEYETTK